MMQKGTQKYRILFLCIIAVSMHLGAMEDNNDPNKQDKNGNTALHLLMGCYYESNSSNFYMNHCLKKLLEKKADPNILNKYGEAPLHYANTLDIEIIKTLLHNKADINKQGERGRTPLYFVLAFRDKITKPFMVNFLWQKGAKITTENGTILHTLATECPDDRIGDVCELFAQQKFKNLAFTLLLIKKHRLKPYHDLPKPIIYKIINFAYDAFIGIKDKNNKIAFDILLEKAYVNVDNNFQQRQKALAFIDPSVICMLAPEGSKLLESKTYELLKEISIFAC